MRKRSIISYLNFTWKLLEFFVEIRRVVSKGVAEKLMREGESRGGE